MFPLWGIYLHQSNHLAKQIFSFLFLLYFDDKVTNGKYLIEEISDFQMEKQKKDPFTGKKGDLIYNIKFTDRDE